MINNFINFNKSLINVDLPLSEIEPDGRDLITSRQSSRHNRDNHESHCEAFHGLYLCLGSERTSLWGFSRSLPPPRECVYLVVRLPTVSSSASGVRWRLAMLLTIHTLIAMLQAQKQQKRVVWLLIQHKLILQASIQQTSKKKIH